MEAFGLAAGVLQVAGFGAEVGSTLLRCAKKLHNASKEIESIARQVETTSLSLKRVDELLRDPATKALHTPKLYEDTNTVSQGCHEVFRELDKSVKEYEAKSTPGKMRFVLRTKWLFDSDRLAELGQVLRRYNDVLHLMVSVMTIVEGRRAATKDELQALEANLRVLTLSNKDLSDTNKSLAETIAAISRAPGSPSLPPGSPATSSARSLGIPMMQQGMMFNTFASVPLENTSNQTAPSDPTGDQLQRCMDSVQELAKTIACAMETWHGRGLLGTLDIRECHGKMSENLKRLPASERCPYCGHLLYWAKTRDTSNRGSLEICNCHATVKRYKSPSRRLKMQKRSSDSDIDVDSKSPDSADELDEDYSEADIKKPKKDGKKAKRISVISAPPAPPPIVGPSEAPEMPVFNTREEYEHWLVTGEPLAIVVDPTVGLIAPKPPKPRKKVSGVAAWMASAPAPPAKKRGEKLEQRQPERQPQPQQQQQQQQPQQQQPVNISHPQTQVKLSDECDQPTRLSSSVRQPTFGDPLTLKVRQDEMGYGDEAPSKPSDVMALPANEPASSNQPPPDSPNPARTALNPADGGRETNIHDTGSAPSSSETLRASDDSWWSRGRVQSWLAKNAFSDAWQPALAYLDVHGSRFLDLGRFHDQQNFDFMIRNIFPLVVRECERTGPVTESRSTILRDEGRRLCKLIQELVPCIVDEEVLPDYVGYSHSKTYRDLQAARVPRSRDGDSPAMEVPYEYPVPRNRDRMPVDRMPVDSRMPVDRMPVDRIPVSRMPADRMAIDRMQDDRMQIDTPSGPSQDRRYQADRNGYPSDPRYGADARGYSDVRDARDARTSYPPQEQPPLGRDGTPPGYVRQANYYLPISHDGKSTRKEENEQHDQTGENSNAHDVRDARKPYAQYDLQRGRQAQQAQQEHEEDKVHDFAVSKRKFQRSRAALPQGCHNCNCAESLVWRRGPDGSRTLCNTCGQQYQKLRLEEKEQKDHSERQQLSHKPQAYALRARSPSSDRDGAPPGSVNCVPISHDGESTRKEENEQHAQPDRPHSSFSSDPQPYPNHTKAPRGGRLLHSAPKEEERKPEYAFYRMRDRSRGRVREGTTTLDPQAEADELNCTNRERTRKRSHGEAFESTDATLTLSKEDSRPDRGPCSKRSKNAGTVSKPGDPTDGSDVVSKDDNVNGDDAGDDDNVTGDVSAVQALLNRWLDSSTSALLLKDDEPVT